MVGSGPRHARRARVRSSSSPAAGASAVSSARQAARLVGRRRRPSAARVPRRRGRRSAAGPRASAAASAAASASAVTASAAGARRRRRELRRRGLGLGGSSAAGGSVRRSCRPSRRCGLGGFGAGGGLVGDGDRRAVCSDAWWPRRRSPPAQARSRPVALRSIGLTPVVDLLPRITNGPSIAQAVSCDQVVRGDRLRGPLLRASIGLAGTLQLSCLGGPGESSTRLSAATIAATVPELPDLTVVAEALHAALAGRRSRRSTRPARSPSAARRPSCGARRPDADRIRRRGKFLASISSATRSSSTRCSPAASSSPSRAAAPGKTAVVLGVRAADGGRRATRPRGRRGRPGCPPTTRAAEVRYRDPTQMGKVYLLPAGVERPVPGRRSRTSRGPTPTTRR